MNVSWFVLLVQHGTGERFCLVVTMPLDGDRPPGRRWITSPACRLGATAAAKSRPCDYTCWPNSTMIFGHEQSERV